MLQKHFPTLIPIPLQLRLGSVQAFISLFQDGALFVYNDAEFTKEDWGGIRSAGFSQKKEKVDKVGRFGIGFSSVYHLTGPHHIFSGLFDLYFFRLSLDLVRNQVTDDGPNPSTFEEGCKDVGLHSGQAQEGLGQMGRHESTMGPDAHYSWTTKCFQRGAYCRNLVPFASAKPGIQHIAGF